MKVYVDTSVLLRRYFREKGSDSAFDFFNEPHTKMVSGLIFVELASVFRRAFRGRKVTRREHQLLTETARRDLRYFRIISAGEEMFRQAAVVADLTGLKSLDSIHLASAKVAGADLVMTFDEEMADAAKAVGLKVRA